MTKSARRTFRKVHDSGQAFIREEREVPESIHRRIGAEQRSGGFIRHVEHGEPAQADHRPDHRGGISPRSQPVQDQGRAATRDDEGRSEGPPRRQGRGRREQERRASRGRLPDRVECHQVNRQSDRQVHGIWLHLARVVDQVVREREERQGDQRRTPRQDPGSEPRELVQSQDSRSQGDESQGVIRIAEDSCESPLDDQETEGASWSLVRFSEKSRIGLLTMFPFSDDSSSHMVRLVR